MRRRAPLHYLTKANNARLNAAILSNQIDDKSLSDAINLTDYSDSPGIALLEGFRREASIALELVIKAVIARKIEMGTAPKHVVRVRPTHDVTRLWNEAELPKLGREDQRLLLRVKSLLSWSSRYAAPYNDKQSEEKWEEDERLRPQNKEPFRIESIASTLSLTWENFDKLYKIAFKEFVRIQRQ